jgi:predicted dinucleotide-binding enzyme
MKIGMIGAGFVARAVAQLAATSGHQVMLSNSRGPKTLSSVAAGIRGALIGTLEDAAAFGDLVLIAIPFEHYRSLPTEVLKGKIVLDANNYYPERDGHIEALDRFETTTSRLVAEHLHQSSVVKVFNAILANDLLTDGRPTGAADRRAIPIASDHPSATQQVARLLDQLGFDSVDAGGLDDSWRFERAKPAYCVPLKAAELKQALADARRDVELEHGSWRH